MEKLSSPKYMKAHYWFILFFLIFLLAKQSSKKMFLFFFTGSTYLCKIITQRQRLNTLLTFRAHRNAKFLLLSKVNNCFKNDFFSNKTHEPIKIFTKKPLGSIKNVFIICTQQHFERIQIEIYICLTLKNAVTALLVKL